MENKIQEALKFIKDEDRVKIDTFLDIITNMKLGDDKKLQGILYYSLKPWQTIKLY